ncbi:MAG: PTS sugar transporter subunit IIA [bacterium]
MDSINLSKFFRKELFIPSLKSEKKEKILKELIKPLIQLDLIKNEDILYQTIIKRETLGSTGIGKSVAIPHCRTLTVSDINIVFGLSKKGVPFNAIDNKDVHIFFLIVAPPQDKNNRYLPLLGKIVEIVRNSKMHKALLKVEDYNSLIKIIKNE